MKQPMIKHYRMPVSRTYPTNHPEKGEPTYFIERILTALGKDEGWMLLPKLHTIRGKFEKWAKIMKEVQEGRAVLDLYYWNGKPYRKGSTQFVFATLDKDSGCGIQKLLISKESNNKYLGTILTPENYTTSYVSISVVAQNDGLQLEDFKAWFKSIDISKHVAIIQFTSFRY